MAGWRQWSRWLEFYTKGRHIVMRRFTWLALVVLLSPAEGAERPNIVFAFADDYGRYASCYAPLDGTGSINEVVSTPHIDRVASEGVLFVNAFVNAPSCTPCRSSLLSGQHFFRTGRGAILRGAVWDAKIPSYPLLLHDAGYHIGQTHKVWSPGTPNDAPYGGRKYEYEKAGGKFNGFSQQATRMVKAGESFDDARAKLLDEVRQNFVAFLDANEAGKPFCYWFGPTNCHRVWVQGSGKALWGIDPDDLKGRLPQFLPDVPEVREDFADYLGECLAFDAAVGVLVDELEKRGEWDNTLFVVSGDHGAPGFPRGKCNLYDFGTRVTLAITGPKVAGGRVARDFTTLPDLAPTFLEAAGVAVPDAMTARSLMPVLESNESGLVDTSRDHAVFGRERHVESAREDNLPYPQRAIRTAEYLYIVNFAPDRWPTGMPRETKPNGEPVTTTDVANNSRATFADMDASPTKVWLFEHRDSKQWAEAYDWAFGKRPEEELYDLAIDPDCLANRAGDAAYQDTRRKLRERLWRELETTADPRVMQNPVPFELPPFTD
jgi:arylsulfatase A-like enzyme